MKKERLAGTALTAILVTVISLVHFDCSKRTTAIKPPANESRSNSQGLAAFTILSGTPPQKSSGTSTYTEVIPPRPVGELRPPAYPVSALMSNYGSARFIVRVHLDATGQVIDIDENPREIPVQNRFSNEFRTEIDKAVRQWKFLPAELQECRKGRDINGDGKIDYAVVISTEKIPVYLDVQFEFSIVDGKGLAQSK